MDDIFTKHLEGMGRQAANPRLNLFYKGVSDQ